MGILAVIVIVIGLIWLALIFPWLWIVYVIGLAWAYLNRDEIKLTHYQQGHAQKSRPDPLYSDDARMMRIVEHCLW